MLKDSGLLSSQASYVIAEALWTKQAHTYHARSYLSLQMNGPLLLSFSDMVPQ